MSSPLKRPPTSGTRKGTGAGHGGPKQGEGNKAAGPGRPKGVKNGEGKLTVADLLIAAGARELATAQWLAILNDPDHPKHADMIAKAADRMDGAPKQQVEVEDKRATVSSEPMSEDDWLASRGLGSAAGAAEGSD